MMVNIFKVIVFWGVKYVMFGMNLIVFVVLCVDELLMVIDLFFFVVVCGKVMYVKKFGNVIFVGWVFDVDGNFMIDLEVVFVGIMVLIGGVKGIVLVLMVEIFVVLMIGVNCSIEMLFFFIVDGLLMGVG